MVLGGRIVLGFICVQCVQQSSALQELTASGLHGIHCEQVFLTPGQSSSARCILLPGIYQVSFTCCKWFPDNSVSFKFYVLQWVPGRLSQHMCRILRACYRAGLFPLGVARELQLCGRVSVLASTFAPVCASDQIHRGFAFIVLLYSSSLCACYMFVVGSLVAECHCCLLQSLSNSRSTLIRAFVCCVLLSGRWVMVGGLGPVTHYICPAIYSFLLGIAFALRQHFPCYRCGHFLGYGRHRRFGGRLPLPFDPGASPSGCRACSRVCRQPTPVTPSCSGRTWTQKGHAGWHTVFVRTFTLARFAPTQSTRS